jgi:transposase-like protein
MRPTAYRRNARGLRDRQAFERVRLQAGALFAAGRSQAQVAHELGVARQNVSRWHARWRAGGSEALRSAVLLVVLPPLPTPPPPPARPGRPRACPIPNSTLSGKRSGKAPAPMASRTTTGPWPASPP